MNVLEFSNEFEVLYNNIMSNVAPGLNEYEKSVLLTQAQEALVIELYNGSYKGEPFESTEELRRYLNHLIKTTSNSPINDDVQKLILISKDSQLFQLPDDVWFITYEYATYVDPTDNVLEELIIVPVRQDQFMKIKNNPHRCEGSRRALRLDSNSNIVELISKYDISKYITRYLVQPKPIILEDLSSYNITINGISDVTECELNPALHRSILIRAVQMAKVAYNQVSSGQQEKE